MSRTSLPRWRTHSCVPSRYSCRLLRGLKPALLLLTLTLPACRSDMQNTPKARTFRPAPFFDDQLSARPLPAGTVPQSALAQDELRYSARVDGRVVTAFPFPITREVLERGQQRFNIFCAPCHGRLGDGNGIVAQRGFRTPRSFHIYRLRNAPAGHFYDVITHGFGAMYDYGDRVAPRDRWAIVAYIRALQLSQNAAVADLPVQDRTRLPGAAQ